jgi:Flp pilus assembly protein TadD
MIESLKSSDQAADELARLENTPQAIASWQKAQQQVMRGQHGPALASYRNLVRQFPSVPNLWAELGIAAAGELDFALASQASQRAAELAADDSNLLISIGQQYHRLRRLTEASQCFEQAVAADPSSVHARLSLAAWLERDRRLGEAWECVETCLAQHPGETRTLYFRAFLLHRQGLNDQAETALRDLLKKGIQDVNVKSSASHLLAVVLDALGQYQEAWRWLLETKALVRQMSDTAALEQAYDKMDRSRRELLASLTPDTIKRWQEDGSATPSPHPLAFLGGPPRSGTTLIEQILGAHPDILVFDEPESFAQEILNILLPAQTARGLTLNALNSLNSTARTNLIRRYFKSLLRVTDEAVGGKLLLDKNPSLTASLPIWLRLFPQLKVIITLREPRDIITSCFFQNLTLTAANVNFLSLDRTARFYADCMDVWLRLRDLGGFAWIETRYEDFVSNLASEGRRVTEFLGLPWHSGQEAYHETARQKFVFAPTYNDVTKPVYQRAVRRWEHYAEVLAPVQERLAPYEKAFGYA